MEWAVIIEEIFTIVLIPLLGLVTKYLITFVNLKIDEFKQKSELEKYNKYFDMLNQTITNVVTATNQTYVNALKEQGKFDAEAQKEAFKRSFDTILAILGEEAQNYLNAAMGDLNAYITNSIERQVTINKQDIIG
jgi:predicted Holliday junction resolvase-like endonuclease